LITTEKYKFKKGQVLHLDDIYLIQGLGDGKWWDASDPHSENDIDRGEIVTIVEDIEFTIKIKRK
jgi:hypothetical protein